MNTQLDNLRDRLRDCEAATRAARDEVATATREADRLRKAAVNDPTPEKVSKADRAIGAAEAAQSRLDAAQAAHTDVLERVAHLSRAGRSGGNGPGNGDYCGHDGWAHAARELSISAGRLRVDMPGHDLLAAGFNLTPSEWLTAPAVTAPFMQKAMDRRGLYRVFPRQEVEQGDLALTEWRQSGSRKVTGSVERVPTSTSAKARLELSIELATPSLVQWAAVVDEVPSKLFDAVPALQAFLQSELAYQLELGIDAHCISQIEEATPPTGEEGATLIEKVRNAVSEMRALGASPSVLALSPSDAASLDVQKSGEGGLEQFIFATRDTGSASPIWGCQVVEVPNLEAGPLLIDPVLAGVLYVAVGSVLVDPYSGMDRNTVRVRTEVDGLLHIRDVAGLHLIAKASE